MMPTELGAWIALQRHYETQGRSLDMRKLFAADGDRFKKFSLPLTLPIQVDAPTVGGDAAASSSPQPQPPVSLLLDYSKNLVDERTMELLLALARETGVEAQRDRMFAGYPINCTEERAVFHVALRNPPDRPMRLAATNEDVMPGVHAELQVMRRLARAVRNGDWRGYTGERITDIVNVGIGGSDLGPVMVCEALCHYAEPQRLRLHFVSNIDGTHLQETLRQVQPATTLFIIVSKTFTTAETMRNALSAKQWFCQQAPNPDVALKKHFIAISTNEAAVTDFGIAPENMVKFWDWVGGRYSLWSAVGLVIMMAVGEVRFAELLAGSHAMDEHFREAPLAANMPVIMALLGVWYNNCWGAQTHAILPYEQYLHRFPAYLQQGDMESNGKSTTLDGQPITDYQTGPVIWGEPGTNGQHAFFQLLHQGTKLVPADFVVGRRSLNPIGGGQHHRMLLANCLAQTEALMVGKGADKVEGELRGLPEEKRRTLLPHKTFPGNRPTNTLVYEVLTPATLGALIALYEHKIFVQGIVWRVNSFDQWGVELGKQLANVILTELESGGKNIGTHDSSTASLIQHVCGSG